ncbi:hypothetical protein [Streptomyces qinzhouensis]|uniref:Uncharacterized protein n=1 Tax=Streptomyces qinzhouensis TaxID=2599401 RepID=A0A5B8JRG5_9ACTN|nr:hypothetical protein [Streptomyces qinzhouensis]QDY80363.1 hypothetical protein FQU76_31935 [Streptomyces qinzhouensis]
MDRADEPMDSLAPTAEEYDAVQAAIAMVAPLRADGHRVTLNALLDRWKDLADEVEEGYSWCAPELSNDIWCRDILASIWPIIPARVQEIGQLELHSIDERYRRATILWPGHAEGEARWWIWRVPRLLEVDPSEQRGKDWPLGWEMMPFPRPDSVKVISRG